MRRCRPTSTRRPRRSSARSPHSRDTETPRHSDLHRRDRLLPMSAVTRDHQAVPAGALSQRRPFGDRSFQALALAAGLLVLVILILIAVSTSQQASSWFSHEGTKIFSKTWNPAANQFGALSFIYGTAITALIALVLSVPAS